MKFLEVIWINGSFGIVKVETEYDGIQYYAKTVDTSYGIETNIKDIMNWGNTVDPEEMKRFFEL
jgi:hypothetical protein